ncbi:3-keto-disaccharide hydrolase [Limisphaera sp. VF-2]|uniref:3-keto-disaccharide hydrolase n=1 Tax=Limisphaera sp. VF-2 TaxID=3400418 RepID=UPI003C201BAB
MKYSLFGAAALGGLLLGLWFGTVGCQTPTSSSQGLALFNGRDLAGWTHVLEDPTVSRETVWSVRDGILICQGKPTGYLRTTNRFTNFRLFVEYRWAPGKEPSNSGILTRIQPPDRPLPRCIEVQLRHGSAGDVLGLQGMRVAEGQPRFFEARGNPVAGDISGVRKLMDAENPPGEWNLVEILARDDVYAVWVNGKLVNEARGVTRAAGPIGLQSEGGEIHFRQVRLVPLPSRIEVR